MLQILSACDQERRKCLRIAVEQVTPAMPLLMASVEYGLMCRIFYLDRIAALLQKDLESWEKWERLSFHGSLVNLFTNSFAWSLYRRRLRSIVFNIRHSPEIKQRLQESTLNACWLIDASPKELWPQRWENLQIPIHLNRIVYADGEDTGGAETYSSMFRCSKCGKRNTVFAQAQTRGADEPITNFVRCVERGCGNRWRC